MTCPPAKVNLRNSTELLPPPRADSFAPPARPRPYGPSKPPYMALKPTRHPSWLEGKSDRLRGLRTRICHRQRYSPRRPEHHQQVLQAPAQASTVARHKVARPQAHLRNPAARPGRPPETRPAPSGTRLHNDDPRQVLALDTLYGKARGRRHGRGLGVETPLTGGCKASKETCVIRSKATAPESPQRGLQVPLRGDSKTPSWKRVDSPRRVGSP